MTETEAPPTINVGLQRRQLDRYYNAKKPTNRVRHEEHCHVCQGPIVLAPHNKRCTWWMHADEVKDHVALRCRVVGCRVGEECRRGRVVSV